MSDAFSKRLVQCSLGITIATVAFVLALPAAAQSPSVSPTFYRQPPVFVENRGQWHGEFLYKTRVGPMTVFIDRTGWTFTIVEQRARPADRVGNQEHDENKIARGMAARMSFVGSGGAEKVAAGASADGVHNYFLGNDSARWRTGIRPCEGVRLEQVWTGIDVACRIESGHFEYDVLVSPGADLTQVAIAVEGADALRIDADGTLVIETALGPVRQPPPKTWQVTADGCRETVACTYVLTEERRFGFSAPDAKRDAMLVIDPGLIYSTFLGGTGTDTPAAVALDASGAAIVAGLTGSTNFPTTLGAFDTSFNGGLEDAFVARLTPTGNALVYATYLGGLASDEAYDVALGDAGHATVVGRTRSTDFPTTPGAFDTIFDGGTTDAFVARLDPTGSVLSYSTYLGGNASEFAQSVALDESGAASVTGWTESTNFPTTTGAFSMTIQGVRDAFVTQLDPTGSFLQYSTYLGGSDFDRALAIAIDATGAITVAGQTQSSDFPMAGAYATSYSGNGDAFVAQLDPTGTSLQYSFYLGGNNPDMATSVALDASGAATVAGWTESTNFTTTPGAYAPVSNGVYFNNGDGFVTRLAPGGNGILYSTFLGGLSEDRVWGIALDGSGAATVVGYTLSSNFPTTPGAYAPSYNTASSAFVSRLSPNGSALLYSTHLGGSSGDYAHALAFDALGVATVVGQTYSANFPTTPGAFDTSPSGNSATDGFVARLQFAAFSDPLTALPEAQFIPSGGILGIQMAGPAGAPVAVMFDLAQLNVPAPPYGTLGIGLPPLITADGIGLGFPGISLPLTIGSTGLLYFSYSPTPAFLAGVTLRAQAVAIHASFAGGAALSTHGNLLLPSPSCQVTFVP